MKNLFIFICLANLMSLASKAVDIYTLESNGISHVTSDPSVSIYLVESKEFKGSRSPAIVTNN